MKRKKVAVYRSALLKYSETFIANQIRAMSEWDCCLVGENYVEGGLEISGIESFVIGFRNEFFRKISRVMARYVGRPIALSKLRGVGADILHIHFGTDAVDLWPLAKKLDIPVVITLHGYDIQTIKEWWEAGNGGFQRKDYPERLLQIAQDPRVTFLAVSSAIKRRAIEYGIDEDKIVLSFIGVDTTKFVPSLPSVSQRKNVLFIGRLVEKKGCEILLRAFREVQPDFPDSRLVVVGDGPLMTGLKAFAESENLNVDFLGALPGDKVAQALGNSRIFCLPSIRAENGDAEGFGLVILEAQSSGVPVITSAEGGREEGICHGVTGFSHEEGDVDTVVLYLRRLLEEDALVTEFSAAAREFAVNRMDVKKCSAELENIYDSILLEKL